MRLFHDPCASSYCSPCSDYWPARRRRGSLRGHRDHAAHAILQEEAGRGHTGECGGGGRAGYRLHSREAAAGGAAECGAWLLSARLPLHARALLRRPPRGAPHDHKWGRVLGLIARDEWWTHLASVSESSGHVRPSHGLPPASIALSLLLQCTTRSPLPQLASATGLTLGHAATRRVLFHYRSSRVSPATLPTGSLQEPLAGRGSPRCPAFARWYPGCGPRPRRHPLQSSPPPPSVVVEGKGERGRGKRE
jgi:hypothetical protein